jgi:ABC-type cobalamin transport system permease subunit
MDMNSEKLISVSEKKREEKDQLYMKNLRRSRLFLLILAAVLLVSMILSLWAGSYDTPVKELFLGIFGKASDDKINIVVQNVRLPRICTAAAAGAGLGITGCILQAVLEIRWRPPLPWVFPRGQGSALLLPLSSWVREGPAAEQGFPCVPLLAVWRWRP